MPYDSNSDLPKSVRDSLPQHAQEIYRAAFNSAWEEYADPSKRKGNDDREEISHKVAWAAVEQEYAKNDEGDWTHK